MVYQVSANHATNGTTYTPPAFCQLMGGVLNGVAVTPPAAFGFPVSNGGATQNVLTNGTFFLAAGSPATVVRSVGLLTCASVIYYNAAGAAYIHHANAGDVSAANFATAIGAGGLNTAAGNIWIIYAHNNASDAGYQATLNDFVLWGVPTNHITEITNLANGSFGINNAGWIGY